MHHSVKVLSMTESTFDDLAVIAVLMRRTKRIEKVRWGQKERKASKIRREYKVLLGRWRQWSVEKGNAIGESPGFNQSRTSAQRNFLVTHSAVPEMQARL
ncbi:hypothetical protein NW765_003241 [Fusarium oxysporum]|nr:hypothetical protein NW765_003241 [Fusarium oxysporum]KAJ4279937.1 hypothetical protein NW764_005802 [Fusarium oxysporum]